VLNTRRKHELLKPLVALNEVRARGAVVRGLRVRVLENYGHVGLDADAGVVTAREGVLDDDVTHAPVAHFRDMVRLSLQDFASTSDSRKRRAS
jgi:hypothetical protein